MADLYNQKIRILIEHIVKGKEKVIEAAKNYQMMGGIYENVTRGVVSSAQKQQKTQEVLARKQQFFANQSDRLSVNTAMVSKIMNKQGLIFDKTGNVTDKAGRRIRNVNKTMDSGKIAAKGFNFAWLSVMFAGMAIYRVFGGIIRQQLQLWGLMEGFGAMITVVMLPVMEMLSDILWPIIDYFMNLPEPVQKVIGMFILLAAAIGLILMVLGQVMLGFIGIVLLMGSTAGPVIMGVISGIVASLGLILLVIALIIAIGVGMYLAWKSNFLGMKEVVQFFIDSIKQWFGGIISIVKGVMDIVKGIFTGDFTLVKEGIIKIFTGLWNFLLGGWKASMAAVAMIVIGALKIVYGLIKVIIDGIGWVVGKAGKLLGFSGEPAWTMPSFQTGGVMPYTGMAYLHKGETITPANQTTNNSSPNITINANISNDYDVRRLADELKRYWTTDFERISKGRSI